MSKFEEKISNLRDENLVAMRDELKQRVENGSLSFGRRAMNIIKAVMGGVLIADTATIAYDRLGGEKQLFPMPGLVSALNVATLVNGKERRSTFADPATKKLILINSAVNLGCAIGGTLLLNAQSRKKDVKELSFVELELARREQKAAKRSHLSHHSNDVATRR
jgi:hypothetical protein